jgi:hypothetical protein
VGRRARHRDPRFRRRPARRVGGLATGRRRPAGHLRRRRHGRDRRPAGRAGTEQAALPRGPPGGLGPALGPARVARAGAGLLPPGRAVPDRHPPGRPHRPAGRAPGGHGQGLRQAAMGPPPLRQRRAADPRRPGGPRPVVAAARPGDDLAVPDRRDHPRPADRRPPEPDHPPALPGRPGTAGRLRPARVPRGAAGPARLRPPAPRTGRAAPDRDDRGLRHRRRRGHHPVPLLLRHQPDGPPHRRRRQPRPDRAGRPPRGGLLDRRHLRPLPDHPGQRRPGHDGRPPSRTDRSHPSHGGCPPDDYCRARGAGFRSGTASSAGSSRACSPSPGPTARAPSASTTSRWRAGAAGCS